MTKNAFGIGAQVIIELFICAKLPSHKKKLEKQAHLENSKYEQLVTHLEKELELDRLEAPDETQMNFVSYKQQTEASKDNVRNTK